MKIMINQNNNILKHYISIQIYIVTSITVITSILWFVLSDIDTISLYFSNLFLSINFIWLLYSWLKISKNLLNIYTFFITIIIITHGSIGIANLFGLELEYGNFAYRWIKSIPNIILFKTNILIVLCSNYTHIGVLLGMQKIINKKINDSKYQYKAVAYAGWTLLLISIIPFILFGKHMSEAMVNGYEAYFTERFSEGSLNEYLGRFLLTSSYMLLAINKEKINRIALYTSLIAIAFYCYVFLISGSRNNSIFPAIAYLCLWNSTIKKIPLMPLIITGIIGYNLASIFSTWRLDTNQSFYALLENNFTSNNTNGNSTTELGIYYYIVATTILDVPSYISYSYGMSYIGSLIFAIPSILGVDTKFSLLWQPGYWIAEVYFPEYVSQGTGFGVGFSYFAEAYLAGGFFIAPIICLLVGLGLGYLIKWSEIKDNVMGTVFVSSVFSFFLFFVRDHSYHIVRSILWYGVLPLLLTKGILTIISARKLINK